MTYDRIGWMVTAVLFEAAEDIAREEDGWERRWMGREMTGKGDD